MALVRQHYGGWRGRRDQPRIPAEPEPTQASRRTTYRVRRGDTLWEIAREHDTTVNAIRVANNLGSSRIKVGDELVIPRAN